MNIKIEGVEEINLKLSRFSNFMLPHEYNKAMLKVGQYGVEKFRDHILEYKSKRGDRWRRFKDLSPKYKIVKEWRYGHIYPILYATGKMYRDIKYKTNQSWRKFQNNRMVLSWGFKTQRSEEIAGYHKKGIKTKTGIVVRNPYFLSRGEKTWIVKIMYRATVEALKKARLKRV